MIDSRVYSYENLVKKCGYPQINREVSQYIRENSIYKR